MSTEPTLHLVYRLPTPHTVVPVPAPAPQVTLPPPPSEPIKPLADRDFTVLNDPAEQADPETSDACAILKLLAGLVASVALSLLFKSVLIGIAIAGASLALFIADETRPAAAHPHPV
jgi:hypothetical protein